jgi:hypothetical protein
MVFIRACQTAFDHIIIKELRCILFLGIVEAEFRKAEREHMDLNITSCKQRCQVGT